MQTVNLILTTLFTVLCGPLFSSGAETEKVCFFKFGCFSSKHGILPSHPNVIETKFFLHTRRNLKNAHELKLDNVSSIRTSNFVPSHKTILIVHGFAHHSHKPWVIEMKNALLMRHCYNVITVDWRKGASYVTMSYLNAVANARLVGAQIEYLVKMLHDVTGLCAKLVHIVGHSLGAHIAGYAGERLARKNLTIGRITGLDPAKPEFEGSRAKDRLDKTDATFVDVIHTNTAPFLFGGAGYRDQLGHVDFYPNGGEYQPGCEGLLKTILKRGVLHAATCHHMRAVEYFTSSIRQDCLFPAYPCSSWKEFKEGKCYDLHAKNLSLMGMQAVQCNRYKQPLYLITLSKSPYCVYNYVILISYSASGRKYLYNTVYVQLIGRDNTSAKKQIQLDSGSKKKLELITDGKDIGQLMSVKLFYYGFSSFHVNNVRVNILHRNEIYVSCFNQLVKNNFWLFWRVSGVTHKRDAYIGEDCEIKIF